jgi:hypothetical protein
MGLGFVLLAWAVIGTIMAGMGLLVFGGSTAYFTRGVDKGRRKAIIISGLFPFACLAWAAIVFVFQAVINDRFFHCDPGVGDGWYCPLPNGYTITMIDVTDQGFVSKPRTPGAEVDLNDEELTVSEVRMLQLAGPYILGGVDSQAFNHMNEGSSKVDSYFVIDTRTGKRTTPPNSEALRGVASRLGINLNLEPIDAVYSRYRYSWFDAVAGIMLCVPPAICFVLLIRWIVRLRRTRDPILLPT